MTNTTWTETGITWNNKPASGTTALATVTIVNNSTTPRWYEWDVTAYLQAGEGGGPQHRDAGAEEPREQHAVLTLSSKEAATLQQAAYAARA